MNRRKEISKYENGEYRRREKEQKNKTRRFCPKERAVKKSKKKLYDIFNITSWECDFGKIL